MTTQAPGTMVGGWFRGKVILAYGLCAFLLLASAGTLKLLPAGTLADAVFPLVPRPVGKAAEEVDREKLRESLAKLPSILAKLGVALLGVAAVSRLVRSIEPAADDREPSSPPLGEVSRRGPLRLFDWAMPGALAVLVLAQLGPAIDRPLAGDELENYEQHLTLPLKGTLTTMGGANNQLGFSILAWGSMRIFGDSPTSVRLPAILGALLLPVVAYRYGLKELGRPGATVLGLLLAIWPDSIMAGMQGRSYSLLMLFALIHLYYFKRFVIQPDRRSGLLFAATLGVACTLHLWFAIVAGAELLFLGLIRLSNWLKPTLLGIRTPLRVESFLLFMTLGGIASATVQAGILPKFLFILTQKSSIAIDARVVLACMAESLGGTSFVTDTVPASYRESWSTTVVRTSVNLVALVGLLACVRGARKDLNARFLVGFAVAVASTFFVVVYLQKPVYLYARFFLVLPILMAWVAARGWSFLLEPKAERAPVANLGRAKTIAA